MNDAIASPVHPQLDNGRPCWNFTRPNYRALASLERTTFTSPDLIEPTTLKQAATSPEWVSTMEEEITVLERNKTWSLVSLPRNVNLVSCKWVFQVKRQPNGTLQRRKAWLVTHGFSQIDVEETYNLVVKFPTIYIMLAIAISKGWPIRQLDVNNAFLIENLKENVFMIQPLDLWIKITHPKCVISTNCYMDHVNLPRRGMIVWVYS